jgi:hypothetical protein
MARKKCEKCKTGRARHVLVEIKKHSSVGPTTAIGGHGGIKEIKNISLCKKCYREVALTQVIGLVKGGMDEGLALTQVIGGRHG